MEDLRGTFRSAVTDSLAHLEPFIVGRCLIGVKGIMGEQTKPWGKTEISSLGFVC